MTSEEVIEALRAAGEPTRLRILALLANEELAVMELSQILDQSQPRVSRHLKLLTEAGLIERFPDGAWVFYRVAAEPGVRHFVDQVLDMIDSADLLGQRDAERLDAVRAERSSEVGPHLAKTNPPRRVICQALLARAATQRMEELVEDLPHERVAGRTVNPLPNGLARELPLNSTSPAVYRRKTGDAVGLSIHGCWP